MITKLGYNITITMPGSYELILRPQLIHWQAVGLRTFTIRQQGNVKFIWSQDIDDPILKNTIIMKTDDIHVTTVIDLWTTAINNIKQLVQMDGVTRYAQRLLAYDGGLTCLQSMVAANVR